MISRCGARAESRRLRARPSAADHDDAPQRHLMHSIIHIARLWLLCSQHFDGATGRCGSTAGRRDLELDAVDLPVELVSRAAADRLRHVPATSGRS